MADVLELDDLGGPFQPKPSYGFMKCKLHPENKVPRSCECDHYIALPPRLLVSLEHCAHCGLAGDELP